MLSRDFVGLMFDIVDHGPHCGGVGINLTLIACELSLEFEKSFLKFLHSLFIPIENLNHTLLSLLCFLNIIKTFINNLSVF